ncbi:MAG: HDIG domain-containing protein [Bacteroidetes bacterium]|nr:HDIG domain-containing protein [Bacteroidota bacterium]
MRRFYYNLHKLTEKDNLKAKWLLLAVSVFLTALMFPKGISVESAYPVGIIWTENDLYAPFAFPIYKDEQEYQHEREAAAVKVFQVFEEEPEVAQRSLDSLQRFFSTLKIILDRKTSDSLRISNALAAFPIRFTEGEWRMLWRLHDNERQNSAASYSLEKLRRDVLLVVNGLYLQGIVDVRKIQSSPETQIAKRKKTIEQIVPLKKLLDRGELGKIVQQTFITGYRGENDTVSVATKIALSFLSPNIIFQKDQTEKEIQFAVDAVPRTIGAVQEGERIIGKNERVTAEIKLKLDSLRKAKLQLGATTNLYTSFLGKLLHVFAVLWLFVMYLFLFRKKIFHDNALLLLIMSLFLSVLLFAYITVEIPFVLPLRFLIFIPAVSMLLTIIFDSRVAFYSTVCLALLVGGIRGNDYSIAVSSVLAGSFAVYTVRDIKKRTQIFRSLIYIFLGYALIIIALSLERFDSLETIVDQLLLALLNAVISPILTYGLLIFLEKGFSITTDLTLLELADLNHPLMKELSHKAPGTFHHSVSVATIAEAAAEAVGANPILARVGAYFHDIGKIANAPFFVENQLGAENKHRAISPRKSARIIASHVQDGVDLARKNKLPEAVINFIPMHHGTIHIGTFYEKALRQKKKSAAAIDEKDFRYAGPKPNSKETGIVMLADGVEASTRAIEDPTVENIEANIESLIKLRFIEGELDDSNLTMRDLNKIKESFLKILIGVHHSRIKYSDGQPPAEEKKVLEAPVTKKRSRLHSPASDKRLRKTIDSIDLP